MLSTGVCTWQVLSAGWLFMSCLLPYVPFPRSECNPSQSPPSLHHCGCLEGGAQGFASGCFGKRWVLLSKKPLNKNLGLGLLVCAPLSPAHPHSSLAHRRQETGDPRVGWGVVGWEWGVDLNWGQDTHLVYSFQDLLVPYSSLRAAWVVFGFVFLILLSGALNIFFQEVK